MVTDLDQMAARVRAELDELPDEVRKVRRPRDEALREKLMGAFKDAKKSGRAELTLNIAEIEADLPEPQVHIPVYLDMNLFRLRQACENRHGVGHEQQGVKAYTERFEM
jgi:hypothetical protein